MDNQLLEFQFKLNKENNSSCQIIKGDTTLYLNEKDLVSLIKQIESLRPDILENLDLFEELNYLKEESNSDDDFHNNDLYLDD